jgi:signal transduction histidine kinase/CheY-like chemotaxis protein
MDLKLPVNTEEDVLKAASAAYAAACESNLGVTERRKAISAALDGAIRAFRGKERAQVVVEDGRGQPQGDPLAFWEEISRLVHESAEQGEALAKTRGLLASLEGELDETNRGVMALYAELDDRADKLRKADDLKSRFLSYASHELRTPLNGIVGLVRLLRSSAVQRPADDVKQLAFIQQAAEEMREMVNDLLDLAKVEAGKITVQPSKFDLGFVFGALRGIFRPLLHSEDVNLIFEDTSAVPSIYSDEAKVSQILRNLLSNAIKFTERGSVRVWAAAEGDIVRIVVSDTGIGIPANELPRIFEEFTQVETPLQRRVRGTGLGLPLCKKFAELLGGQLTVESTPGKGSAFTLILPRMYPVKRDHRLKDESKTPRTRATLLIVDDIEIDRYLLSHLITASGDYDIIQAADGQAGLQAARKERPDLIFLDVNLPLMDGFAVASELAGDPATRDIPIFAVTAEKLSEPDYDRLRSLTRGIILKENLSQAQRVNIDFAGPAQVTLL